MIAGLTQDMGFGDKQDEVLFKTITPEELLEGLGNDPETSENFLRTAVLVAIADGLYSPVEGELLRQFSQALGGQGGINTGKGIHLHCGFSARARDREVHHRVNVRQSRKGAEQL